MTSIKKMPMRQCVGCRTMFEKKSLMRIVKSPEGEVSYDFTGKKSGRGIYVCKNAECIKKAEKSKILQRTFECEIPEGFFEQIRSKLEEMSGNG